MRWQTRQELAPKRRRPPNRRRMVAGGDRCDRRRPPCRSVRRSGPPQGRQGRSSPALHARSRRRSMPSRLTASRSGTLNRVHDCRLFRRPAARSSASRSAITPRQCGGEWIVRRSLLASARCSARWTITISREGTHLRLFDKLGAHVMHHEGADGVHFAVWAPNARARLGGRRLSTTGTAAATSMRSRADTGIWEIFIPGVARGRRLQVRDHRRRRRGAAAEGRSFAFQSELRPQDGLGRRPAARTTTGTTRRIASIGARCDARRAADLDLRGASGLVAARDRTAAFLT